MAELFAKIIEFFEKITIKKILVVFIIGSIITLCFPLIDYYFYFNYRTTSRIEVLDKVTKLELDVIKENAILQEEYNSILSEIQEHGNGPTFDVSGVITTQSNKSSSLYKFLTGGFWCWLVIILTPFIYKKKLKDMIIAIIIFGLIGTILGWVSTRIPTFINPIYNYVGFPTAQIVIVIIIAVWVNSKSKKNKKTVNAA